MSWGHDTYSITSQSTVFQLCCHVKISPLNLWDFYLTWANNELKSCIKLLAKINFDKTQVVWIGSKKYSSETIKTKWKLSWGCQRFKILGINFNLDLDKMEMENYKVKLQQLENIVKHWEKRLLTPPGKITIIKTFMISVFNHLFLMLPNPSQNIIQQINKVMFSFLWNNKTSKIKVSTVQKQYCVYGR